MAPPRPKLTPPSRGIFDEMVDEAAERPPGSRPTSSESDGAAAPQGTVSPEVADTARPVRQAQRRRPTAQRTATAQPSEITLPPPPPQFLTSRKPLQIKLDPQVHWTLKIGLTMRGRDMSSVVAAMINVFNAAPDEWLALIDQAEQDRSDLGETVSESVKRLLSQE